MNKPAYPLILLLLTALTIALPAQGQQITACDWEAAHPSDPDRVGPGRSSSEVNPERAIAACKTAIASGPDTARFHYQLGRAQVYGADRAGTDWRVGMPALTRSAEAGHRQAMFVLGLMHQREGEPCAAEPWTRAAAEAGLKSARLSYVNDTLAGALDRCEDRVVDSTVLRGWLDAAQQQVSGYYENMLLGALIRELSSRDAAVRDGVSR